MSDALLSSFATQAGWCERAPAPFTARLIRRAAAWLAQTPAAHAACAAAAPDPVAGAVALRLAAALHHLALQGIEPFAALWPPAAGPADEAALDAALDAALRVAWLQHRPALLAALAHAPQTNEVMRGAALLPGLLAVAAATGLPLALREIGSSAGINLWCERWRHAHGAWVWDAGDEAGVARPTLTADWRGPPPPLAAPLAIASRAGCDLLPVNLSRPGEALRLASFVWADQRERLQRLRAAAAAAAVWQTRGDGAVEALPAADFVERELAAPRAGIATVLMHSVVWHYLGEAQQRRIAAAVEAAGAGATAGVPLAWLRFEPPRADQACELRLRLWRGAPGDGEDRLLARCHPHGTRIEWLQPSPPGAA